MFGWQKPCYLLQDGYVDTFKELIEETKWEQYGEKSGNPRCANCMVHCGFEPSAVNHTFGSLDGMIATVKGMLSTYDDPVALAALQALARQRLPRNIRIRWCRSRRQWRADARTRRSPGDPMSAQEMEALTRETLQGWIPPLAMRASCVPHWNRRSTIVAT